MGRHPFNFKYFRKKQFKKRDRKWRKKRQNPPHHSFTYLGQPTTHHNKPRSRGGTNNKENTIKIPWLRHNAWHLLFANKTPEEITELIKTKTKEEITENKRSRVLAWEIIFGYWETTVEERIKIIKNFWMPKEG